jgi:hypothetical protein
MAGRHVLDVADRLTPLPPDHEGAVA